MKCLVYNQNHLLPTGWRFEPGATAKEIVEKEAGAKTSKLSVSVCCVGKV